MNALVEKYGDKGLVVLAVPCNQFGLQEPSTIEELPNTIKYVRPGDGFEFKGVMTNKANVNGADAVPLYHWLRVSKPIPEGAGDLDMTIMSTHVRVVWSPVTRGDLEWNFWCVLSAR